MRTIYLCMLVGLSSLIYGQNLNFTIDNAVMNNNRIEESIVLNSDTYMLRVTPVDNGVATLATLSGVDMAFYLPGNYHDPSMKYELFKNGSPVPFTFESIDFDNPFNTAVVDIKNDSGTLISDNANAGGSQDGGVASGTIIPMDNNAAANINSFSIFEGDPDDFSDVAWHNIRLEVITISAPLVQSINLVGSPNTTATSISYTVVFDQNAINVSSDDFVLTTTGSASGTISSISGSGTTYTLTITGLSGEGTIRLDLPENTDIRSVGGNDPPPAFTIGDIHTVSDCFIENFESYSDGAVSFTSNGVTFNAGSSGLSIEFFNNGGAGLSDYMFSNKNNQATLSTYSFTTSSLITLKSWDIYLSSILNGTSATDDGSLIITGKRNGQSVYQIHKNTGFLPNNNVNHGYITIDFQNEGGVNNSLKNIDEIEISLLGAFQYMAIDNLQHCEPVLNSDPPIIQSIELDGDPAGSATIVNYNVVFNEAAVNVTMDDFMLNTTGSVTGMINSLTGSGSSYQVGITGVTGEGELRLDLKGGTDIEDLDGNAPADPFTAGQVHLVTSCSVETFETVGISEFLWTTETVPFTTGSANLKVREFDNTGAGASDRYLDNLDDQGTNKSYSISITNAETVSMESIAFYLSSALNGGTQPTADGTLTITGKKDGVIQYSVLKTTGFLVSYGTTQGFFTWDFSTEGGVDHSSTIVDEIQIQLGGMFQYISIDNFKFCRNILDCTSSAIIYVNANAAPGGTGTDWSSAYNNLQDALTHVNVCPDISQIWVAQGTYVPTTGTDQTASFVIPDGVSLLGGFNGSGTNASGRNWASHPTILSGDIGGVIGIPDAGDSHTIIRTTSNDVLVDGFIIENSFADDFADASFPAIGRAGGGIYNNGSNTIRNCIFRNNHVNDVDENSTVVGIGGGLVTFGGSLNVINCLFYENFANANGGAVSCEGGQTQFINCTIADNDANRGGGIHFYGGSVTAVNTLFSNNSGVNGNLNDDNGAGGISAMVSYCLFDAALPIHIVDNGNNIFDVMPSFTNATNDDYTLMSNSLAINQGNNSETMEAVDLNGNSRIQRGKVDIGAYESACYAPDMLMDNFCVSTDVVPQTNTWVDIITNDNKFIGQVNINANTAINSVSGSSYVSSLGVQSYNGSMYASRQVSLEVNATPTEPVSIRLYFSEAEIDALLDADMSNELSDFVLAKTQEVCTGGTYMPNQTVMIVPTIIEPVCTGEPYVLEFETTSFSTFYLFNSSSALPVHLIDFSAENRREDILLQWSTASEVNNEKFIIEHSLDIKNWRSLGYVSGKGTTTEVSYYDYTHTAPSTGINYYRLKQLDFDGRFEYSPIRSVLVSGNIEAMLFPNPAQDRIYIQNIDVKEIDRIIIRDVKGRMLMDISNFTQNGLNVSSLSSGAYFLEMRTRENVEVLPFMLNQ